VIVVPIVIDDEVRFEFAIVTEPAVPASC